MKSKGRKKIFLYFFIEVEKMWTEVAQQLNSHIEKCSTCAAFILKTSNCFLCYLVFAKFIETIKQKLMLKNQELNVIIKRFFSEFY